MIWQFLKDSISGKYLIFLLLSTLLFSCIETDKYLYPNDPRLSSVNGLPKDTVSSILPFKIKYKGKVDRLFLDSSSIVEYNKRLNFALCPLLYNYYLNEEIYRFSIFCSIKGSAIFTMYHSKSGYFLNLKVTLSYYDCVDSLFENLIFKKCFDKPKNTANKDRFLVDNTIEISRKDWNAFKEVVTKINFYDLNYEPTHPIKIDGSDYVIEAHTKYKYWLVQREHEDDNVVLINNSLIKICDKFQLKIPKWISIMEINTVANKVYTP